MVSGSDHQRNFEPEDVLEQYEAVLGEELALRLKRIVDSWASLWITWENFNELFLVDKDRHRYLKESARGFFDNYRRLASQELILGVCRLTDGPNGGGHSIRIFVKKLNQQGVFSAVELAQLDIALADILSSVAFARKWRNKVYAHRDYDVSDVPGYKWTEVEAALNSIHTFLDRVERFTRGSALAREVIHNEDHAVALLYVLRDGLESQKARKERFELREYTSKDVDDLSRDL